MHQLPCTSPRQHSKAGPSPEVTGKPAPKGESSGGLAPSLICLSWGCMGWLSLIHTTRASSPAPLQGDYPNAVISRRQGQFSCAYALGANSPPPKLRPAPLCYLVQLWGPFSQGLQPVNWILTLWESLPVPSPSGPALLWCPDKVQGPLS